ncbi:Ig-like domain-containing protein [Intrasporangium sp. DVR]|uniref:Ig-like domain-containing protein n=1 Tax=Intrasporangium sp. DVR TaxID=3127867 RepID=UPI00313A68D0
MKCTASGAGLAVDVTNDGTVATDLVVRSDFGEHAVSGVAPGATTSHVFPIDTRTVAAGGVTVKARTNADGIPLEATVTADYAAADCRAEATLRARLAKDTIRAGQSGTINVTVTGAQGRATGTVVASEGDIELLGATLDPRGGASIRLPRTFEVGEHVLVVRYSGDGTYRPATTEVTLTVT